MKKLMLAAIAALTLSPAPAPAQVGVQIHVNIPVSPPLVVVQPGIQVVEDWDEEVFFTGGYYWVRRDGFWYRAPSPRAQWVYVEPRFVPPGLTRTPPGQYMHYRRDQEREQRKAWKEREKEHREAWKEQEKEQRKAWKEREKEQRKAWKEQEKEGRGEGRGRGRGRDRGDD